MARIEQRFDSMSELNFETRLRAIESLVAKNTVKLTAIGGIFGGLVAFIIERVAS